MRAPHTMKKPVVLITILLLLGALVLAACDTGTVSTSSGATPTVISGQPVVAENAAPTAPALGQLEATPPKLPLPTPLPKGTATPTAEAPATGKTVADNNLRPKPDGFSFENYAGKKRNGKPVPELTIDLLLKMFGAADVCVKYENGVCTPRQEAVEWMNARNYGFLGGHCEGMAVVSLLMFKGLDVPSNYGQDAKSTFDLKLTSDVKSLIAYYFTLQTVEPVTTISMEGEDQAPSEVLDTIIASLQNGSPDPVTLGFYGETSDGEIAGHAITPYAVDDMGDGIFRVYVYDNNWPDNPNVYMEIDRSNETWNYDLSARNPDEKPQMWKGDAETRTLGTTPLSARTGTLVCPWCPDPEDEESGGANNKLGANFGVALASTSAPMKAISTTGDTKMQISLEGEGHLLITDSQGRRVGYDGTRLVNEIPGATYRVPLGGMGVALEPTYRLPKGESYSITLDGQTVAANEPTTGTVSIFGRGISLKMQDVMLKHGEKHTLNVSSDLKKLSFTPGSDTAKPTFRFATSLKTGDAASADTRSYLFEVANIDVAAGSKLDFALDRPAGKLEVKAPSGAGLQYDLEVVKSDQSGTHIFKQANINLGGDDTHTLSTGGWTGGLGVTIGVDEGSTGSVDSTQTVPTILVPTPTPGATP